MLLSSVPEKHTEIADEDSRHNHEVAESELAARVIWNEETERNSNEIK